MLKFNAFLVLATLLGLSGCSTNKLRHPVSRNEHIVASTLWHQTAAEAKALSYQAFNLAKIKLDEDLKIKRKRPRAVVVDVDETVLDNSGYQVRIIQNDTLYPEGWEEWIDEAKAPAMPGSVEFLNYAYSKGVTVFYLTNRGERDKEGTTKNLIWAKFPGVNSETVVVKSKTDTSSKESRRRAIAAKYDIVLLIGDNLNDITNDFYKNDPHVRVQAADRLKNDWGHKFIVIPNPMYGDWESAIYEYNHKKSDEERDRLRKSLLRPN